MLRRLQQVLQLALSIPMAVQNSDNYARGGTIYDVRGNRLNFGQRAGFINDGIGRRLSVALEARASFALPQPLSALRRSRYSVQPINTGGSLQFVSPTLPTQEITTSFAEGDNSAFISSIYAHMERSPGSTRTLASAVSLERRISEINAPHGSIEAATLESLVSQLVTDYSCL